MKINKKITVEHVKTNSHQFQVQLKLGKNFLKSEYSFNANLKFYRNILQIIFMKTQNYGHLYLVFEKEY